MKDKISEFIFYFKRILIIVFIKIILKTKNLPGLIWEGLNCRC